MTLQELWALFPIFLVQHNNEWSSWYFEEEQNLKTAFTMYKNIRIDHIGSTAIDTIWAKPIIDILIQVPNTFDLNDIKQIILSNDYRCMSKSENRMDFNKGYTIDGFADKVFHLHLRYSGDNDELYFRDYLNENEEIAKDYEKLKLSLWKQYEHDRDGYTNSKSEFINRITHIAKEKYLKY